MVPQWLSFQSNGVAYNTNTQGIFLKTLTGWKRPDRTVEVSKEEYDLAFARAMNEAREATEQPK